MDIKRLIKHIPKYMNSKQIYSRAANTAEKIVVETVDYSEGKILHETYIQDFYITVCERQGDAARYLKDPVFIYVKYFPKGSPQNGYIPKVEIFSRRDLIRYIIENNLNM